MLDVDPAMDITRGDWFAPVLSVIPFDDESAAIAASASRIIPPRKRLRHLQRRSRKGPRGDAADGHAPGHRHLPAPEQHPMPQSAINEQARDQPWIRTSHSDSQVRRPRR